MSFDARSLKDASTSQVLRRLREAAALVATERTYLSPLTDDRLREEAMSQRGNPDLIRVTAIAVEMAARTLNVELHDEQVMAGIALSTGWTVQMRTGEGKTFAAIGPSLFFALRESPVHLLTSNQYLARRDESWSGAVLRRLGVSTGAITPTMARSDARAAYHAEVTYSASADVGFDFLRDNLWLPNHEPVQRGLLVAIVDEADAVLLDHARTPLVLSAPRPIATAEIRRAWEVAEHLVIGRDVNIDDAHRWIALTEEGIRRCETGLGVPNLYTTDGPDWPHLMGNALRAQALLKRDRDYVVAAGRVAVVDELTGRAVPGRRWGEGLHQAVEAKEGVAVTNENAALARTTIGGLFDRYDTVVGMSGTLDGAEDELAAAFGMRVVALPPHSPVVRRDHDDLVFGSPDERVDFVAEDAAARQRRGQPVLIGTTSIAATQTMSTALTARGVVHRTLAATNDAEEATIIAEAGRAGSVTVATQMAGRGVDIVLGGSEAASEQCDAVRRFGGLMVWGIEHHPAHRLDMQLRGRAGRQGDPGESQFAICPADESVLAAPGNEPVALRAVNGQRRAEAFSRELRDEMRAVESVVDRLQNKLYEWRERAAKGDIAAELAVAVESASRAFITKKADLSIDRSSRRRRRSVRSTTRAIEEALTARRRSFGEAQMGDATRVLLRHLLVVLWTDELENLDLRKQLAKLSPIFDGQIASWHALAVESYRGFETRVRVEWVRQLLAFEPVSRITDQPEEAAATLLLPASAGPPDVPDEDRPYLRSWDGWSFNRFVRQHFAGAVPEPPLVLNLDAVGDPSRTGTRVRLDLDIPARTQVRV